MERLELRNGCVVDHRHAAAVKAPGRMRVVAVADVAMDAACERVLLDRCRCYNSESTRAQRPAGSVCAHARDGRPCLALGSSMQYNRRKQTQYACETVIIRRERVITNRVAYTLYAGLMPQRQAITMSIIYCSKPQQADAVTPTPLAHRSHTCMRALALGHDSRPAVDVFASWRIGAHAGGSSAFAKVAHPRSSSPLLSVTAFVVP